MLKRRYGRRNERGQVLVLALGFIFVFAALILSTLTFAGVATLQHNNTEVVAHADAAGEGGAAFAAADAARTPSLTWCAGGASTAAGADSGTLTMADGASTTATYSLISCDPGQTASTVAAQGHCLLCILNQTPFGSTSKYAPTTKVFSASCAQGSGYCLQTTGGDDYINGSIGGSAGALQLQACSAAGTCPGLAKIGVLDAGAAGGGTFATGCCSPTPTGVNFTTPVADPLASIGDPSTTVSPPSGCTRWQTCKPANCNGASGVTQGTWSNTQGCSITLAGNQPTTTNLYPGVWNAVTISGQANVVLQPGVYVLNGTFSNQGKGIVCAPGTISGNVCTPSSGVTLYLTCAGGKVNGIQLAYIPCPTAGGTGGTISFSGGGNTQNQVNFFPTPCPAGQQVPNCPGYDGVALLADPHLLDPNTGQCIAGAAASCAISIAGNGGSINGSIDTRSAGIVLTGNGGESVTEGFLIANSLSIQVTGKTGTGLALAGPGSFVAVGNSCSVLVLGVYTGSAPSQTPTAVIQTRCGSGKLSGVVDFNYLP